MKRTANPTSLTPNKIGGKLAISAALQEKDQVLPYYPVAQHLISLLSFL